MGEVVDDVASRLWPGRVKSIEVLAHGITNSNFVVDLGDERVVVRVPGANTQLLGIDRTNEVIAGGIAAAVRSARRSWSRTRRPGASFFGSLTVDRFPRANCAKSRCSATSCRRFASCTTPAPRRRCGIPTKVIRDHRDVAIARDVQPPFDMEHAFELLEAIEVARPVPSDGARSQRSTQRELPLRRPTSIVDWEYAGMSDPFFDLANVAVNNFFPEHAEHSRSVTTSATMTRHGMATLALMKIVSELREAMWGVVQMAISKLDVDFTAYATERGTTPSNWLATSTSPPRSLPPAPTRGAARTSRVRSWGRRGAHASRWRRRRARRSPR